MADAPSGTPPPAGLRRMGWEGNGRGRGKGEGREERRERGRGVVKEGKGGKGEKTGWEKGRRGETDAFARSP